MTASGAEECVYTLKTRGRATIVGEPTVGATNLPRTYLLDEHHVLQLPEWRPISPVTGSNWEGGIAPDIPAKRDDALTVAYHHALAHVAASNLPDWLRDEAAAELNAPARPHGRVE